MDQPPVVCHMTDGASTGEDPELIVRRIMNMSVPDGNVLIENIFISDEIMQEQISNIKKWEGIMPNTEITDEYGAKLQRLSSPIPQSYREMMTGAWVSYCRWCCDDVSRDKCGLSITWISNVCRNAGSIGGEYVEIYPLAKERNDIARKKNETFYISI